MSVNNEVLNIERDVARINTVLDKIDQSVDKLTAISAEVTQLLAVREVRMTLTEKQVETLDGKVDGILLLPPMSTDDIYELVEKTKVEFVAELEELKKELLTINAETHKKVSAIERWMWISLGVLAGAALFVSNIGNVLQGLFSLVL